MGWPRTAGLAGVFTVAVDGAILGLVAIEHPEREGQFDQILTMVGLTYLFALVSILRWNKIVDDFRRWCRRGGEDVPPISDRQQ